jgi:disulfide bond formation protein DsbB
MRNFPSARLIFAALGLGCVALLAMGWYVQYGPDKQQPCPLCILQRYGYIMLAVVYLTGAVHGPRRTGALVYAGIGTVVSAAGCGIATWQVSKGSTMLTCLADPIGDFVNNLPTANAWPEYFFATGGCADKLPPVLGLTVPVWSLICYSLLTVISLATLILVARRKAAA